MTDERLTGLALMCIHPEMEIDPTSVIDRFVNRGIHRVENAVLRSSCRTAEQNELRTI